MQIANDDDWKACASWWDFLLIPDFLKVLVLHCCV